jgi:hypothetical protein
MLPDRRISEEEPCPVRDEVLGELYRASKLGLPLLVETVEPELRAMLALFCYRKSHLHSLGVTIAASCSKNDLIRLGTAGEVLFLTSWEAPPPPKPGTYYENRRKITLATGCIRKMAPINDELDEAVA